VAIEERVAGPWKVTAAREAVEVGDSLVINDIAIRCDMVIAEFVTG
jgi:hypothetical protein